MKYEAINTDAHLADFCASVGDSPSLGFDTEFVSEDTYRPDLCLIQVAVGDRLAILDPKGIEDLKPFWNLLAAPNRETVVHAGREEFRFCVASTGQRPSQLFDLQIAAGLIGLEYPASLSTLVYRLLGKSLSKGETRTNWRTRPLSDEQLRYALIDVVHLAELREKLHAELERLGRLAWLADEMNTWQDDVAEADRTPRWRRVSGIAGLSARQMAVVREIWTWREREAEGRNIPAKWVLRDDLLVELARRKTADPKQIKALRGMERGDLKRHLPDIAACIEEALRLENSKLPRSDRRELPPQMTVLGQFLTTALGNVCRSRSLAGSLVGSVQDVRDLIAARLGLVPPVDEPPRLAQGWRAEVVGDLVDDLLAGRLALRVGNPLADEPLVFERFEAK